MTIGLLKEPTGENRVALLPENIKTLTDLKVTTKVETDAGKQAFTNNEHYEQAGATISSRAEVLKSEVLVAINPPTEAEIDQLQPEQVLICVFQPLSNKPLVEKLLSLKVTSFSLDNIPRTTRAQAMDVLSSMATVAGYKAVLMAASASPRFFPMFMTAAGSIIPSKVLVLEQDSGVITSTL